MNDTTPDIEKRLATTIATRSPAERLRMASRMFDTGRTLLRIGLKSQNQSLSEAQLRAQVFLRLYGEEFASSEINRIASSIPNMTLDADGQANGDL
ncbi:MAG: hypothetical protein ACYDGS_00295 [Thermoleophilia bacterium]